MVILRSLRFVGWGVCTWETQWNLAMLWHKFPPAVMIALLTAKKEHRFGSYWCRFEFLSGSMISHRKLQKLMLFWYVYFISSKQGRCSFASLLPLDSISFSRILLRDPALPFLSSSYRAFTSYYFLGSSYFGVASSLRPFKRDSIRLVLSPSLIALQ